MKTVFISVIAILVSTFTFAQVETNWFKEARTYSHHLFISKKACMEAQKEGMFFNCSQVLQFSTDGRVTVMVTDIMNRGHYEISGNKIQIKMDGRADAPETMTFLIDQTGRNLIQEGTTSVWELKQKEDGF